MNIFKYRLWFLSSMSNDIIEKIMKEFDENKTLYLEFCIKTEKLIKDLLKEKNIVVSSITSRVKERPNLLEKLNRPGNNYSNFNEITDIAGVRIVTYFTDDVDKVAKIICDEFDVDPKKSVDKRVLIEPDRFGYISLHYIAKFLENRLILSEYHRFPDCQVEIQMRTILQHAWAENEHDIGYKTKDSIPRETRRYFSRLAGLLEIADSEFVHIRNSLQDYEKLVISKISETPELVLIDKVTLNIFIQKSPLAIDLDEKISIATNARIKAEETNSDFIDNLVNKLKYVGLKNIADINSSLLEFGDVIVKFTSLIAGTGDEKNRKLRHGICLFNLIYVKVACNESPKEVFEYLEKFDIENKEERNQDADYIISNYKRAIANRN